MQVCDGHDKCARVSQSLMLEFILCMTVQMADRGCRVVDGVGKIIDGTALA